MCVCVIQTIDLNQAYINSFVNSSYGGLCRLCGWGDVDTHIKEFVKDGEPFPGRQGLQ
jgi:hypothetical protein